MKMVFKFLFAVGFVFALVALRVVTAYLAWRDALNEGITGRFPRSRDGFGGTHKIYHPDL